MVSETLAAGEILANCSGGGGGWGNPFTREPEKVREDVCNGYISLASATRDYQGVINPETMLVDTVATATLRGGRL